VKLLFRQAIKDSGLGNTKEVAVTAVVSTYKAANFIENPILYTKPDGTQVTNFHDGLAMWAGTSDKEKGTNSYHQAIDKAIRRAEQEIRKMREQGSQDSDNLYGTEKDTMRFNKVFPSGEEFAKLASRAGVHLG